MSPYKTALFGLAYGCPYLERQVDCPFKQWKKLSFYEKVQCINKLNEEEKEAILEHHQVCSKHR